MRIEKIGDFQEFLSIREEWNSLMARSSMNCVSMTHEWLSCWWEAFGGDAELWVLLLREDGRLVGAAPLLRKRERFRGLPVKTLSLMVNGHSPECDIILSEPRANSAANLLDFLRDTKDAWDMLLLEKLPAGSISNHLQEWTGGNDFFFISADSLSSPYIQMTGDWHTYYAGRSSKFRKVMRNKLNRVKRGGNIAIERVSDAETIKNALDEIFSVSARSWKAREGRSIPDDPRVETFYRKLTDAMAQKGIVELWLMRHDGEAIAFEYHLRYGGIAYPIRADFDERFRELSPGSVLEYHIIKSLFDDPEVRGYNSCGDTYEYLMKWATEMREHAEFQIFSSKAYSRNLFHLESKMVPIARRARNLLLRSEAAGADK